LNSINTSASPSFLVFWLQLIILPKNCGLSFCLHKLSDFYFLGRVNQVGILLILSLELIKNRPLFFANAQIIRTYAKTLLALLDCNIGRDFYLLLNFVCIFYFDRFKVVLIVKRLILSKLIYRLQSYTAFILHEFPNKVLNLTYNLLSRSGPFKLKLLLL